MFAPSSIQKVPPGEGEMNKENVVSTTSDAAVAAPPTAEMDTGIIQPVSSTPLPTSEELVVQTTGAMDSVTQPSTDQPSAAQPSTGSSTIFVNHNEPDDSDDESPILGRKRKRNSTNVDYLAGLAGKAEPTEPAEKKSGWTWKGTQGPTWKGHEVKHGVPIGVWSLSDEPIDERKHVLYGFLDPKLALHGRKYPERKDGSKYTGNFPSGTGTWAAKSHEWLLDPHLKGLSRKELTEYVRIRVQTWNREEKPEVRDALDQSAVAEAKEIAAASESNVKIENKGTSAKKSKKTPRKSNEGKPDKSTPGGSYDGPSSSPNSSTTKGPEQVYTPSANRAARNDSPLDMKPPKKSQKASPLPMPIPDAIRSITGSPSRSETPPRERSKYVIKGKDVLIGYWKDSSEPEVFNKHAMYGVIQAHGVFRVKVVPETRDGRYLKDGNYPKLSGGCWVNYDTCVFEKYLKDLIRTEIEEYCRICVADPDYNEREQGPSIDRAVREAKRIVAEKAAAKGMNIIEYNRKRVDQLEQGALAREVEKQRKNGEVVVTPLKKVEVKHTAKRSDKAASDARAQMVRQARIEAKEAKERETLNSKGDADLAEAIRRSTSEQEALEARKKSMLNSNAPPAKPAEVNKSNRAETNKSNEAEAKSNGAGTKSNGADASWTRHAKDLTAAYSHLRQGNNTPTSTGSSVAAPESDRSKFHLLDRETQRVKMEKWCRMKVTSQYHNLDREGQRRHVEKHIDQLIAKQTGAATPKRPKKRSRTGDYPAQLGGGAVSAPSPLSDMTRAVSTPATATQEPAVRPGFATMLTAAEAAPVQRSARTESPAVNKWPGVGSTRTSLSLRSVLNEPMTPIPSESEVTPQPKSVENTVDVAMVDAPVETTAPVQPLPSNSTPPAEYSATPVATVETAAVQDKSSMATTQPAPMENTSANQPSRAATQEAASRPSHPSADVPMADAPHIDSKPYLTQPPRDPTAAPSTRPSHPETDQFARPQFPSQLHHHQQVFSTPQNPRGVPADNTQGFMSAPPRAYITPYPTPPFAAAAAPSSAPPVRAPALPPAPLILQAQDGIKYSSDPSSEFGDLLVSVDRELVDVDDEEYTRQVVLVAKKAPRPPKGGEEKKVGGEVFRMVGEGVFGGYWVGVERKVTRLGGEDWVKFVVLVPF
ncbi:hypothetical protein VE01_07837 [Pseudogymnoascus verrucosus]|uniref:Uncharacterized protein n=1 Tax=Pseudogymnoascus verrucosus TaxID=342668 RepID=A0A1B8GEM3_9PEZI|nr:uncharacterized protein VE01_07837 [Pseudogymnoascus verrucosus]OBT94282.1 hypothetical protein VE01_07837 [Pseudogymnoascus verrucosus]